jgi:hypothetical protein
MAAGSCLLALSVGVEVTEHGSSAFADIGDEIDRQGRHDSQDHFSVAPSSRCSEPMLEVMINHRIAEVDGAALGIGDPPVVQHLEQRTRTTSADKSTPLWLPPGPILAMPEARCQSHALHQMDKLISFVNDPVREASRR